MKRYLMCLLAALCLPVLCVSASAAIPGTIAEESIAEHFYIQDAAELADGAEDAASAPPAIAPYSEANPEPEEAEEGDAGGSENPLDSSDFRMFAACGFGMVFGSVSGVSFMSVFRMGV